MSRVLSGDMLVDFLQLAGVWPNDLNPARMGPDTMLPTAVTDACERLCEEVRASPLWLAVSPELANWCTIVDPARGGATRTDQLARLPVDGYEWTLFGPLYYTTGVRLARAAGAVVFSYDGWYAPNSKDQDQFKFISWATTPVHRWPGHLLRGGPGMVVRRGKAEFDPALAERELAAGHLLDLPPEPSVLEIGDGEPFLALDHSAYGSPSWGPLSLKFASAVLDRILPEIRDFFAADGAEDREIEFGGWTAERIRRVVKGGTVAPRPSRAGRDPLAAPGGGSADSPKPSPQVLEERKRFHSGDMIVDLLQASGAWPADLDPATCLEDDGEIRDEVAWRTEQLSDALTDGSEWYEIGPSLSEWCGLVLPNGGRLPVDRLAELPGLELYPWHKRGLLWYSSDLTLDGIPCGPVVFLRDGWIVADPAGTGNVTANKWDAWIGHRLNDDGTLELGLQAGRISPPADSAVVEFRSVKQMSYLSGLPTGTSVRVGSRSSGSISRYSLEVACRILDMMEPWVVAGKSDITSFAHPPISGIERADLVGLFS